MTNLKPAKTRFGQLGDTKAAILHHLHMHGATSKMDLEMKLNLGSLAKYISNMCTHGHIVQIRDPLRDKHYKITNAGRISIGVTVPDQSPIVTARRICNASMQSHYDPALDSSMGRIGLAMCGAMGRVNQRGQA